MRNQVLISTIQTSPDSIPASNLANTLWQNKEIGFLLGLLVVMQFLNRQLQKGRPGQFTTGRFASGKEIRTAARLLKKQHADKGLTAALKVGQINLPFINEGGSVAGAPGSGKTFSVIDPAIRSALRNGYPIIVYDSKGVQTETHAAYAASLGYQVSIFAPGKPYTGTCNLLDFVKSETDSLMSYQLAYILEKNSSGAVPGQSSGKDFFERTGVSLVEAAILLAKLTEYPDLLTVGKILNLPMLIDRIKALRDSHKVSDWVIEAFAQLLSSEDAEKQVAGMIVTAQNVFKRFVSKDLLPSFCGETTIPLDLNGKQILFLQTDIERKDAVTPLLAAVLQLIISRNFSYPRKTPLMVSVDEFPSLHLPAFESYLNELRSAGLIALIGYQNFSQLRKRYGPDGAKAMIAACGTQFYFNPRDFETAREFSQYLGEKEVTHYTKSRSYGKNRSRSRNQQVQKVALVSPDEFLKFRKGECVYVNPGHRSENGAASVPVRCQVKIDKKEIDIHEKSLVAWRSTVRSRLIEREAKSNPLGDLDKASRARATAADIFLPLPVFADVADDFDDEY
ncbi:MAG: type IV secretion system DNA-binding domain-containing protein [Parerythrobacter sp.]